MERYYVRDVTQTDLINGAVKGMLQGLDPHSTFLTAEEYKEMQETTSGEFFGVGIEISMENGQVTVVTPIEDTPAFRAGLQSGDVIPVHQRSGHPGAFLAGSGLPHSRAQRLGSGAHHPAQRCQGPADRPYRARRHPLISVNPRNWTRVTTGCAFTRFSERTTEELHDALKAAEKESKAQGGLKGIVLDLRNNPGGLLDQAVSVSDTFLEGGTIVSIKGRREIPNASIRPKNRTTMCACPWWYWINAGSASASEIVAGALRDQKRALIAGERSFGKGSVQNIIPLTDGSGLVDRGPYYTPNGSSIQAEGIVPDLEIPL